MDSKLAPTHVVGIKVSVVNGILTLLEIANKTSVKFHGNSMAQIAASVRATKCFCAFFPSTG